MIGPDPMSMIRCKSVLLGITLTGLGDYKILSGWGSRLSGPGDVYFIPVLGARIEKVHTIEGDRRTFIGGIEEP